MNRTTEDWIGGLFGLLVVLPIVLPSPSEDALS
jgi:hypothetical protein